jgi:hypothetical protein
MLDIDDGGTGSIFRRKRKAEKREHRIVVLELGNFERKSRLDALQRWAERIVETGWREA